MSTFTEIDREDECLEIFTIPNTTVHKKALDGEFLEVYLSTQRNGTQTDQALLYNHMILRGIALGLSKEFK